MKPWHSIHIHKPQAMVYDRLPNEMDWKLIIFAIFKNR
jgi:hypothetical protein